MPMQEQESAGARAWKDTETFRGSLLFFIGVEVIGLFVFAGAASLLFLKKNSSLEAQIIVPFIGAIIGLAAAYTVIFMVNLVRAPYRQRNESEASRAALSEQIKEAERQRQAELDRQPCAELVIAPRLDRGKLLLDVTNQGDEAAVEAQIEALEGFYGIQVHGGFARVTNPYAGHWAGAGAKTTRLMTGQKDTLLIGGVTIRWQQATFEMWFCNQQTGAEEIYNTNSWMWPDSAHQSIPHVLVLRVTISTTPRMRTGPFVRDYQFTGMDSGAGAEITELPRSTPDMADSPSG